MGGKHPTGILSCFIVRCLVIRIVQGGGSCSLDESFEPAMTSSQLF